jgi:hypothetical protein
MQQIGRACGARANAVRRGKYSVRLGSNIMNAWQPSFVEDGPALPFALAAPLTSPLSSFMDLDVVAVNPERAAVTSWSPRGDPRSPADLDRVART